MVDQRHIFLVIVNVFDRIHDEMWSEYIGEYSEKNISIQRAEEYIEKMKNDIMNEYNCPIGFVSENFKIENQIFEISSI